MRYDVSYIAGWWLVRWRRPGQYYSSGSNLLQAKRNADQSAKKDRRSDSRRAHDERMTQARIRRILMKQEREGAGE